MPLPLTTRRHERGAHPEQQDPRPALILTPYNSCFFFALYSPPADMSAVRILKNKIHGLQEANPMLGLRGCRLGIRHPGAGNERGAAQGMQWSVAGQPELHWGCCTQPASHAAPTPALTHMPMLLPSSTADITEMQAKAILEAAVNVSKKASWRSFVCWPECIQAARLVGQQSLASPLAHRHPSES